MGKGGGRGAQRATAADPWLPHTAGGDADPVAARQAARPKACRLSPQSQERIQAFPRGQPPPPVARPDKVRARSGLRAAPPNFIGVVLVPVLALVLEPCQALVPISHPNRSDLTPRRSAWSLKPRWESRHSTAKATRINMFFASQEQLNKSQL